jgi:hypothetical protein
MVHVITWLSIQITAAKETSSGISLSFLKKILIGSKLWNIIILSQGNPDRKNKLWNIIS